MLIDKISTLACLFISIGFMWAGNMPMAQYMMLAAILFEPKWKA